jgi:2-iminobutanoate/2-iminopropanoate deaminase
MSDEARRAIQPEGLAVVDAPYSPVVVSGDLVFLSGQVPYDDMGRVVSTDFSAQAVQVFENLSRCLTAAGCDFGDVVKVTAFVTDFENFGVYNEIYTRYFNEPFPARTTVRVDLYDFLIEVEAIARRSLG